MVQELAENNVLKDFGQDAQRTTVKSTYMKGLNSPERLNDESCLTFIRSGQNHIARRQHQGKDRTGVRQVPEGSGEQGKMEETGCEVIYGAPTTLMVKGLMMMLMMMRGMYCLTTGYATFLLPIGNPLRDSSKMDLPRNC